MKYSRDALILVLSYIIGFTTAYIAFGIDKPVGEQQEYNTNNMVSAHFSKDVDTHTNVGIAVREDGLYALLGDKTRILSAQAASASASRPGWHYKVIETAVSPNNRYVYYCVQMSEASSECVHYVYQVDEDIVYKVSQADGEQLSSDINSTDAGWTETNLLSLNGYISASVAEPWRVVSR